MHTLTLEQLRTTTDAGGVKGVTLKAEGGDFIVQIDTLRGGEAVLAKARSTEPRRFGNPAQALSLLRDLGLTVGAFNVEQWNPHGPSSARTRPDRAQALRRTHQAASYDQWFRAQVAQGLAEADDPGTHWISHASAKEDMQRQRAALQALVKGSR
ncbi:hypothetical protein [Delftia sp. PS-11]|uniref:hypothetical protein n=1 Tax=Delftia sp. PS-11 TaxID=2767222 RepID=UPI002457AD8A|nr:hypothetical protein [Delftia sp. PS-11]KAJ8745155.1 hypothetical protein H9T68_08870 [Delftia sp. PS-11]